VLDKFIGAIAWADSKATIAGRSEDTGFLRPRATSGLSASRSGHVPIGVDRSGPVRHRGDLKWIESKARRSAIIRAEHPQMRQ